MRGRWTPTDKHIAKQMWNRGDKVSVIAAHLGRTDGSVTKQVRRLGVKPRGSSLPLWNRAKIERLLSLWGSGKKHKEIAEIMGVPVHKVSRKLQMLREKGTVLVPYRYNLKREAA